MASPCFFLSFLTAHSSELRQLQPLQNVKKLGFLFRRFSHLATHIPVYITFHSVFFFPVWQAASTSTTKHRLGTVVSKGSQIHSSYGGYLRNETKQASLSRLGLGKQRGRGKFLLAKVQQPSRLEERRRRKKRLEPLNLCLCRIYVQRNVSHFFYSSSFISFMWLGQKGHTWLHRWVHTHKATLTSCSVKMKKTKQHAA